MHEFYEKIEGTIIKWVYIFVNCKQNGANDSFIIDWRWPFPVTSRNVHSLSTFWSILARVLKRAVLSILECLWKSFFSELFAPSFVGLVIVSRVLLVGARLPKTDSAELRIEIGGTCRFLICRSSPFPRLELGQTSFRFWGPGKYL